MTCIIGLVDKGTVYIGGDSSVTGQWDVYPMVGQKVFTNQHFIIGTAGIPRVHQILKYHLEVRPPTAMENVERYMVSIFIPAVQACFAAQKYDLAADEYSAFMVGCRGRLFQLGGKFSLEESAEQMMVLGSAGNVALGAMAALADVKPDERILRSLAIAQRFSHAARPPYYVRSLAWDGGIPFVVSSISTPEAVLP